MLSAQVWINLPKVIRCSVNFKDFICKCAMCNCVLDEIYIDINLVFTPPYPKVNILYLLVRLYIKFTLEPEINAIIRFVCMSYNLMLLCLNQSYSVAATLLFYVSALFCRKEL